MTDAAQVLREARRHLELAHRGHLEAIDAVRWACRRGCDDACRAEALYTIAATTPPAAWHFI